MNIQKLMKQAQEMQNKLTEVQSKFEQQEVEGTAGGGMVKIVLTGKNNAKSVSIDASLIDPSEKEVLEDLIVAAINDARAKVDSAFSEQMSAVSGSLGLPPGMKLPF
jgi:DNA-binding YbaB/EbfC family protein